LRINEDGVFARHRVIEMREWLEAHKPAASRRAHLLLAALMWSVVGAALLAFGVRWMLGSDAPRAWALLGVAVAIAVGLAKGRLLLERAAGRIIERIRVRGDGYCIGGFLSLWTWGLVAVMVAAGRLLRGGLVPEVVVGFLYTAVGTALVLACRRFWQAWYAARRRQET
jgi:hypothetical protein